MRFAVVAGLVLLPILIILIVRLTGSGNSDQTAPEAEQFVSTEQFDLDPEETQQRQDELDESLRPTLDDGETFVSVDIELLPQQVSFGEVPADVAKQYVRDAFTGVTVDKIQLARDASLLVNPDVMFDTTPEEEAASQRLNHMRILAEICLFDTDEACLQEARANVVENNGDPAYIDGFLESL